jgi:hypothetical protein
MLPQQSPSSNCSDRRHFYAFSEWRQRTESRLHRDCIVVIWARAHSLRPHSDCTDANVRQNRYCIATKSRREQALTHRLCHVRSYLDEALWPGQRVQRTIGKVKHHLQRSWIGWVTKSLLSLSPLSGRHVKQLVPASFTVVSTHQSALYLDAVSTPSSGVQTASR